MATSVYIHIPFCENKCHYCDFNSYVVNGQPVQNYLKALDLEMEYTVHMNPPEKIKTIFIGGGTPTVLSPRELELLFQSLIRHFPNWESNYELTVEANPGTIEIEKLKVMKAYGVNRISMGVQSFHDKLLSYIGRIHNEKDVYRSLENAQKTGFDNISIDLMFGLPNQTREMFFKDLNKAFQLGLKHFSAYSLKVEENTLFHSLYEKNKLPLPKEEEDLEMFLMLMERMKEQGYIQYEISNFAKKGYESKHNINYWKNGDYYGLGAGAHGYINNLRHENMKGINPYNQKVIIKNQLPRFDEFKVSIEEKMEDMMMLGLRMLEGVKFMDFQRIFQIDLREKFAEQIDKLVSLHLIELDDIGIRLTDKGVIYGNEVFAEFISL